MCQISRITILLGKYIEITKIPGKTLDNFFPSVTIYRSFLRPRFYPRKGSVWCLHPPGLFLRSFNSSFTYFNEWNLSFSFSRLRWWRWRGHLPHHLVLELRPILKCTWLLLAFAVLLPSHFQWWIFWQSQALTQWVEVKPVLLQAKWRLLRTQV